MTNATRTMYTCFCPYTCVWLRHSSPSTLFAMRVNWCPDDPMWPSTHQMLLLTRTHYFLGRIALVATSILTVFKQIPDWKMTQAAGKQPDYNLWEALLQKYVKPSEIRGIPLHSVDYEGESLSAFGILITPM